MVSILLIILKIIGITLLIILGVLLLVILLVLFVPVRYRLKGYYEEALHAKGKITWLLHLVSVKIEVEKETTVSARILGIPLSAFQKKPSKETSSEMSKEAFGESAKESVQETAVSALEESVKSDFRKSENNAETEILYQDTRQKAQDVKKQSLSEKIAAIREKWYAVKEKIQNFIKSCKNRKVQFSRYIAILRSDTVKAAFALCRERIFKLLKHIFPKKMHADITFGFEDPAVTGYVLAIYGMLPSYVGKNMIVHPDFDKQILKGNFKLKGHVRAGTLLYHVLRILTDTNCRKLYHIVKKEIANEHK